MSSVIFEIVKKTQADADPMWKLASTTDAVK
jgi:hypothetical protein